MNQITRFLIFFSILFSANALAIDENMMNIIKSMKIDKTQVSAMLDNLQKMGKITPKQVAEAKKELNGLSNEDLNNYKKKAISKVKSGDAQRIIEHDYTKSTPKINASLVEEPEHKRRVPTSDSGQTKVDFLNLGQ